MNKKEMILTFIVCKKVIKLKKWGDSNRPPPTPNTTALYTTLFHNKSLNILT